MWWDWLFKLIVWNEATGPFDNEEETYEIELELGPNEYIDSIEIRNK